MQYAALNMGVAGTMMVVVVSGGGGGAGDALLTVLVAVVVGVGTGTPTGMATAMTVLSSEEGFVVIFFVVCVCVCVFFLQIVVHILIGVQSAPNAQWCGGRHRRFILWCYSRMVFHGEHPVSVTIAIITFSFGYTHEFLAAHARHVVVHA